MADTRNAAAAWSRTCRSGASAATNADRNRPVEICLVAYVSLEEIVGLRNVPVPGRQIVKYRHRAPCPGEGLRHVCTDLSSASEHKDMSLHLAFLHNRSADAIPVAYIADH